MKFWVLVGLLMLILAGDALAADEEVVLGLLSTENIALEVGKTVNVVAREHPTTGYVWVADVTSGGDKIEQVGDSEYYREFISKEGFRAGSGVRIFQYKALKEGEARISFYLMREGVPYGTPAQEHEVVVKVNV